MISTNAYFHTFFVKATQYGTAFTIDVGGSEYLVTARHLLDGDVQHVDIKIFFNNTWLERRATVVGRGGGDVDVAVLRLPARLTPPEYRFTLSIGGFTLGQEVYFLGFPYKMSGEFGTLLLGHPCAFVKKGAISFVSTGDVREFFVDAINNDGFSGGPLCVYTPNDPHDVRVLAVVSKYRIEHEPILDSGGEPTDLKVAYNTGFLVAYGVKHVLEIIERQTRV